MIISIASGKGGTGKTTVATNMARSIGSNVQLLDCDVEEPNAYLFMNPSIEKTEPVFMPVPVVSEEKCTYCGKCSEICQFKAIAVVNENVLVFEELCHSCGGCWEVCPEDAIPQNELGAYYIDPELCTNCGTCVEVCPEEVIFYIPGQEEPFECDLCGECVDFCGMSVLSIAE